MQDRKQAEIAREMDEAHAMSIESVEAGLDDDQGDELLGLIFDACHPAIPPEARAALTLRLVGGLTARAAARAFLTSDERRVGKGCVSRWWSRWSAYHSK